MDGRRIALKRHRQFVSNTMLMGAGGCSCRWWRARGAIAGVYGGDPCPGPQPASAEAATPPAAVAARLLGVDWMNRNQLAQAIPPAYTEHIGVQLLDYLRTQATGAA